VGVASGVATFYSQFPPDANMTVDIVITSTNLGATTLILSNCGGNIYTGYSLSSVFEPGITVYSDITLTTPLDVGNNVINIGTSITSGYPINNLGVIGNILTICD
jgi:hypothetical protein